VAIQTGLE